MSARDPDDAMDSPYAPDVPEEPLPPVVLDTNVFVGAAFNPRSASATLLARVREGALRLRWNARTRGETRHVLERIPRLRWADVSTLFREADEWREPTTPEAFALVPDPDDREFAALAAAAGATLVSSDAHLLDVRDRLATAVRVRTPGEYLRELEAGAR